MCGICGVFNYKSYRSSITEELIIKMRDTMIHRGPDGEGCYISSDYKIGLGHRRLAILDLTTSGNQPMSDDSGEVIITYNGEIYNFLELRKELIGKGYKFHTQTDTEVIICLYKEYGKKMLSKLRGMFAFAIWDSRIQKLLLVRDRLGVKPLYYTSLDGNIVFASEIKSILAYPGIKKEADETALYHYLSLRTVPAPMTFFKGISKLSPGHLMEIDKKGNIKQEEYWDVLDNVSIVENQSEEVYTEQLFESLQESVKYRMVSDVPVGVFLSGGVDSSSNVALMKSSPDKPVRTFSIGISGKESQEEIRYARKVSELFHTDHHEIQASAGDFTDFIPQMIHHQEEPNAISSPLLYYIAKLARDKGTKVCMAGEGSDELFAGYPNWLKILRFRNRFWTHYKKIPLAFKKFLFSGVSPMIGRWGNKRSWDLLRRATYNEELFWGGSEGFGELQKNMLLSSRMKIKFRGISSSDVIAPLRNKFEQKSSSKDYLQWMCYLDLKIRVPELLLARLDKMTMAASVEGRVPFLDHKFVEHSMSIPSSFKNKNNETKYILKKSLQNVLPNEILYRKKQGFPHPVEWVTQDIFEYTQKKIDRFTKTTDFFDGDYIKELLEGLKTKGDSSLAWILLNYMLWYEYFIE